MFDRELFLKILARLSSPHDGEVLVAARQALRMLDTARLTWDTVVRVSPGEGFSSLDPGRTGFNPEGLVRDLMREFGQGFGESLRPKVRRKRN